MVGILKRVKEVSILAIFVLSIVLLSSTTPLVYGSSSFQNEVLRIFLFAGDKVTGTISGDSAVHAIVEIVDPAGSRVELTGTSWGAPEEFAFTAETGGYYTFLSTDSFVGSGNLHIEYSVDSPTITMATGMSISLIAIGIIGAVFYRRHKKKNKTKDEKRLRQESIRIKLKKTQNSQSQTGSQIVEAPLYLRDTELTATPNNTRVCPSCGTISGINEVFCGRCGYKLSFSQ